MKHAFLLNETTSPLSHEQAEQFNRFVESLRPEQMSWISGYLAGLSAGGAAPANQPAMAPGPGGQPEITILYGSQTGNCEKLAEQVHRRAQDKGLAAQMYCMADFSKARLKKAAHLLVIVSTHGEGDPPDNAREVYELLNGPKAPPLKDTRYSVLALGDSSYENFCQTGKDFDARLETLGARRIHPRADCDVDFEGPAGQWIDAVLGKFGEVAGPAAGAPPVVPAPVTGTPAPAYSKQSPFAAAVLENLCLNGRGSDKEVRHIELSLEGSGLAYEPGDALGVVPANPPEYVAQLIETLALDGDEPVTTAGGKMPLHRALGREYEITTVVRPFVEKYAELSGAAGLTALLADENKPALRRYLEGRHVIDVVREYPVGGLSAAEFLPLLRRLPPRLYSIASSLKASPDEVHLTVAAVRYHAHGRERMGLASTFLADRVAEGETVPVYVERNKHFKLPPDPDTPVIMIGPGTGVAPFRAFMAEREETGAAGRNWLFFGDRHMTTDFLYQREWLRYRKEGLLTRLDVAWSRDSAEKDYVQHRMHDNARELYAWLQDGAHLYVCGDAQRMAHDVHQALLDIVAAQGGLSPDDAGTYVKQLQKDRRYQRDVY